MRMNFRSIALVASLAVAFAIPAIAHHAFNAEFDRQKPIELTGKVTRLEWANPHARIYFDVVGEKGQVVNWDFEMGSPNGLMRQGWSRNSLKPGDEIKVNGWLAKHVANV